MFNRLKQKWNVSWGRLILIFVTFASGGSLCGYLGRRLLTFIDVRNQFIRLLLYLIIVTIFWPGCVLVISLLTGQFRFFCNYLKKLLSKMQFTNNTSVSKQLQKIAIFASGAGSNARKIIEYFANDADAQIALIVCNKPDAGVIAIAAEHHIPVLMIEKERFMKGDAYLPELQQADISLVILAGFLWKIPEKLVEAYPAKIINIHPALLPKYGGKGMYGHFVHEAVINAGDNESGITIHLVDELYDNGKTIFQATCPVLPGDTADTLAHRIHELEHRHFAPVIKQYLDQLI